MNGRAGDLRAPIVGLAAWCGGLLALALPSWLGWVVAGGCGVVLWRAQGAWRATVACWLVVGAAVWTSASLREAATRDGAVATLAERRTAVEVVFVVASDPVATRDGTGVRLRAGLEEVAAWSGRQRLRSSVLVLGGDEWAGVQLGARVRARGRLAEADDDGDLAAVLHVRGPPEVVRAPGPLWRASGHVRESIRAVAAPGAGQGRELVPALVTGDDSGLGEQVRADFRTSGLTHLLAVSGTNLTLVLGFLLLAGRWCGVRGRWLLLLGAVGVLGFVLVARTEPSVVRAAAMGAVALVGLGSNAGDRGPRALGVAVALLLLWDPWWAVSVGFALSVLATGGILFLAPRWRDALATWMPRWLATALAVPAAAQLVCTPIVAAISGEVSLVAVAANLLAGPLVAPATVLGLAGGLAGLVARPLGALLGVPATWAAAGIVAVARHAAGLATPAVDWDTGPLPLALLTLGCLVVVAVAPALLVRATPVAACSALLAVVVLVPAPSPGWPPDGWVLAVCDVGQGDALAVRAGPRSAVVVDAGPDPALVDRCLDRLEVRDVPLVVLTHFHADHVDGLRGVYEGRRVGAVEATGVPQPVERARSVLAVAGRPPVVPAYGLTRQVGEARLQVLGPLPDARHHGEAADEGSGPNNASVVLLAEVRGVRILLTGDVEPEAQADLAASLPGLSVDVLKVPHHGSRHQDHEWLASLGATVAIASAGEDNDYGHPAPETMDRLAAAGARVLSTHRHGDVVVSATGGGIAVHTR